MGFQVVLLCDVNLMTCKEFESDVLKRTLNLPAPDVVHEEKGTVIISSEEEDNEFNYDKTLHQMGLVDGAILLVDDFIQNYKLRIILSQRYDLRTDFTSSANFTFLMYLGISVVEFCLSDGGVWFRWY